MSSKSSRHSGVRIRRDKLENAIISSFSIPYLMGSDFTTCSHARDTYVVSWRKILEKNLEDYGVRIQRDKLKNVIISRFSKQYLMGSDLTTRFTAFLRKILRKNLDKKS